MFHFTGLLDTVTNITYAVGEINFGEPVVKGTLTAFVPFDRFHNPTTEDAVEFYVYSVQVGRAEGAVWDENAIVSNGYKYSQTGAWIIPGTAKVVKGSLVEVRWESFMDGTLKGLTSLFN